MIISFLAECLRNKGPIKGVASIEANIASVLNNINVCLLYTSFQCSTGDPDRLYDVAEEHPDYDVVLLTFLLDDEREMEVIPNDKMRDLEHTLQIAQELGLSVIFRAAYDFIGENEDCLLYTSRCV